MKQILSLLALGLSFSAVARDGFPEGHYVGTGTKRYEDGRRIDYRVEMAIARAHIAFTYRFPSVEKPIEWSLDMTFGKEGFFTVGKIGEGYCGETACHWSVTLGPGVTEQWTLVFDGNELFKTGSLVSPKSRNWWEEHLTRD